MTEAPHYWSSNSHWSLNPTPTRTPGTTIPTALDDCYVDGYSFSGSGRTLTVDVDAACQSLDTTGMGSQTLAVDSGKTLAVTGTTILADGAFTVTGALSGGTTTLSGTLTNDGDGHPWRHGRSPARSPMTAR